jgi:hypothetical protein
MQIGDYNTNSRFADKSTLLDQETREALENFRAKGGQVTVVKSSVRPKRGYTDSRYKANKPEKG